MTPFLITTWLVVALIIAVLYAMFVQWSTKVSGVELKQPKVGIMILLWSILWPFSIPMLIVLTVISYVFQKKPSVLDDDKMREALEDYLKGKKSNG